MRRSRRSACWCRARCARSTRSKDGSKIEGRATYAKFRRYQVKVGGDGEVKRLACAALPWRFLPCCCCCLPALPAAAPRSRRSTPCSSRAGAYVLEFQQNLAGVVSEEQYVQDVRARWAKRWAAATQGPAAPRAEVGSAAGQAGRRRPVDPVPRRVRGGRPADPRSQRAAHAALPRAVVLVGGRRSSGSSTRARATTSATSSARSTCRCWRWSILDPANQRRFRFKRIDAPRAAARRRGQRGRRLWVIEYKEVEKQTMIRTDNGRDLPARGRFWIEPDDRARVGERADRRGSDDQGHGGRRVPAGAGDRPARADRDARALRAPPQRLAHRRRRDLRPVPAVSGEGRRKARPIKK